MNIMEINKSIQEILEKCIYKENYVEKYYKILFDEVIEYNSGLNITFINKLYNFINKTKEKDCEYCGRPLIFREKMRVGYGFYCSKKCTSIATRDKVKKTNLKNFGVEYPLQCNEIKEKQAKTNIEKYGFKCSMQNIEIREKRNKTILEKYGVENISQLEETKEKKKNTTIKNYGVENPFQSNEIKEKIKRNNLENYGVEHISQLEETKEKTKKSNMKKYGVEHVLQLDSNREKLIEYNLKKYGTEYPMQNNEYHKKLLESIFTKYGVKNASQTEISKETNNKNIIIKWSKILNVDPNNINYSNSIFTLKNYCKLHEEFDIKYDDLYNRFIMGCTDMCTKCNKINKQSKIKEKELELFLNTLSDNVIVRDRKILNGKEIDFYLPDNKFAVEFDGLFWHSNKYCETTLSNKLIISAVKIHHKTVSFNNIDVKM